MITFNIRLPKDELFCPVLACDVYDHIFKGACQPLLGTFNINIGDIKSKYVEQQQEDLRICDQLIADLKDLKQKDPEEVL